MVQDSFCNCSVGKTAAWLSKGTSQTEPMSSELWAGGASNRVMNNLPKTPWTSVHSPSLHALGILAAGETSMCTCFYLGAQQAAPQQLPVFHISSSRSHGSNFQCLHHHAWAHPDHLHGGRGLQSCVMWHIRGAECAKANGHTFQGSPKFGDADIQYPLNLPRHLYCWQCLQKK